MCKLYQNQEDYTFIFTVLLSRCNRLGLTSFAYLWRRDQKELLYEMANAGVNAILIKIAAIGLKPTHLGKSIGQMYPFLCKMVSLKFLIKEIATNHQNLRMICMICIFVVKEENMKHSRLIVHCLKNEL